MKHESIMSPATQQSHPECCPPAVDRPPCCLYCTAHWGMRPTWRRGRRRCCWWSCRWRLRREIKEAGGAGGTPELGFDLCFGGLGVVGVGVAGVVVVAGGGGRGDVVAGVGREIE